MIWDCSLSTPALREYIAEHEAALADPAWQPQYVTRLALQCELIRLHVVIVERARLKREDHDAVAGSYALTA